METKEIIRAGCFEGDKIDPKALCEVPKCRFEEVCIWKGKVIRSNLGSYPDNRGKILQHG